MHRAITCLYDGWAAEANGDHARILLNATIWLATPNRTATATRRATAADFSICPNPSADAFFISGNVLPTDIRCVGLLGRAVQISSSPAGAGAVRIEAAGLAPGLYALSMRLPEGQVITRQIARQ